MILAIKITFAFESRGKPFYHPFFCSLACCLAMAFCMFYYFLFFKRGQDPNDTRKPFKLWIALLPTSSDFFGYTLNYYAVSLLPASVYNMVRTTVVIFVVIYSILILKKKYERFHWISLAILFVGTGIVGWGGIWNA